jgi:fumarylacetoacetase
MKSFLNIDAHSHFSMHNIPFGVFRRGDKPPAIGTRIGEYVVDLGALEAAGVLKSRHFAGESLNRFMATGRGTWREARGAIQRVLSEDSPLRDDTKIRDAAVFPVGDVRMLLPCHIGDYTDFYSSRDHATNVGIMFRGKENALMPNWLHLPVGYHGRSSSIVVSGTDLRRPRGQTKTDDATAPAFGPSRMVDFELETGFFIGPGNELGQPIPISRASEHIFGMVLVNDWSARDIQKWEYVPLGPFLAKNFGTSISPWIVTMDALEPFRIDPPSQDPQPLDYLLPAGAAYDISLEVSIQSADMANPHVICRSNVRNLYWTMQQQLAHHTCNGCNVRPGDLLASGTISGQREDSFGSMLELAWNRTKPITLPNGQQRVSIQDGDRVTMSGCCEDKSGEYRVGFGEVTGRILPVL